MRFLAGEGLGLRVLRFKVYLGLVEDRMLRHFASHAFNP